MTTRPTILVADDETTVRQVITTLLREEGFNVVQAEDGADCMQKAYKHQPDLVLLDILMPNKDGREVCRALREVTDVPIIMLSALTHEKEKVERFCDGADDYIAKPFGTAELVARIRTVLRRNRRYHQTHERLYDDGYLFIDLDLRALRINQEEIELSQKEWKLLDCLFKNKNRLVSRQTLLKHVWGSGYERQYNYLKVYVSHLRRKIKDSAQRPRYIHTDRDLGYRFETHN